MGDRTETRAAIHGPHWSDSPRLNRAATCLPDGMRSGVAAQAAIKRATDRRTDFGKFMSAALRNAAAGIPVDAEQAARWKRLGIASEADNER